jgi:hypothetical protein
MTKDKVSKRKITKAYTRLASIKLKNGFRKPFSLPKKAIGYAIYKITILKVKTYFLSAIARYKTNKNLRALIRSTYENASFRVTI